MGPLLILTAGAIVLLAGVMLLLSFGEAYRIARLLQTTPQVSLDRAIELARADGSAEQERGRSAPYVRVRGRIDSDEAFPDEHRRPLVFRRTRLQVRGRRGWRTLDERLERVPFLLQEGLSAAAVRDAELNGGLVVIPRESAGTAAEVHDRLPAGLPGSARVRVRIDQLSAVEHATVLGVPRLEPDGSPILTAGPRHPLILTTLEDPEAMRVLAADAPRRPLVIAALLATGLGLLAVGLAWLALDVLRVT